MTYQELIEINSSTPSLTLLTEALMESISAIDLYRELLANDKRPYWKGKITYQSNQRREIEKRILEIAYKYHKFSSYKDTDNEPLFDKEWLADKLFDTDVEMLEIFLKKFKIQNNDQNKS